jgi:hypothetical protein
MKNDNTIEGITFLKKNHFPMDIFISTEMIDNIDSEFNYVTTIMNSSNNIISEFKHKELEARILWIDGFFTALRMQKKKRRRFILFD